MTEQSCRILLVDDEPDIIEFLQYNLEKEGYETDSCLTGEEALEKAVSFEPHIILLDLMMPGIDGVETSRRIRENKDLKSILICFLSARTEEFAEIAALEAGADDYLYKPISLSLLNSHIKVLTRRHPDLNVKQENHVIEFKDPDLKLDRDSYQVFSNGVELELSKKEFEILWLLASKPGKVLLRNQIQKKVWGTDIIVGTRTMDVHISKLRNKVGKKLIKTIKGIGYKLEV